MLLKGNKERTQEPTAANKTSSRSHAVLQVSVKQQNRVRSTTQEVRIGRLFMIDLAGSERAANTHNRGKRMVEGAHINRSLLALGNCINALSKWIICVICLKGKNSFYILMYHLQFNNNNLWYKKHLTYAYVRNWIICIIFKGKNTL